MLCQQKLILPRHPIHLQLLGVSGMFQYFIKIVPTTYKGKKIVKEIDPQFDFTKGFPTFLGGIEYSYRDPGEIETQFSFAYSQFYVKLLEP